MTENNPEPGDNTIKDKVKNTVQRGYDLISYVMESIMAEKDEKIREWMQGHQVIRELAAALESEMLERQEELEILKCVENTNGVAEFRCNKEKLMLSLKSDLIFILDIGSRYQSLIDYKRALNVLDFQYHVDKPKFMDRTAIFDTPEMNAFKKEKRLFKNSKAFFEVEVQHMIDSISRDFEYLTGVVAHKVYDLKTWSLPAYHKLSGINKNQPNMRKPEANAQTLKPVIHEAQNDQETVFQQQKAVELTVTKPAPISEETQNRLDLLQETVKEAPKKTPVVKEEVPQSKQQKELLYN